MDKHKVILIHSNALALNIRGFKEIEANSEKYNFTFFGWNRNKEPLNHFRIPEGAAIKFLNVNAPYGKLYLLTLPFWWTYVFLWLIIKKWDIVHVINLDSALPALLAARLKRKKAVYEILDTYEDCMDLNESIRNLAIKFDKLLISGFDSIILVDEEQVKELEGIPNKNIRIIYDSPPQMLQEQYNKKSNENELFTIFYAGAFHKDRKLNLNLMFNALEELDDVRLMIAGYGDKDIINEINGYKAKMPHKINFIGKISYEEVLKYSKKADMLFQFRDPAVKVNKYICGSTLFNSMISGTPIVVNKGTSTAIKVKNEQCGLIIDVNNKDEIKNAILKLKDNPDLKKELGINARKAYDTKYSWKIMENELKSLYNELTDSMY
ncbi:MAG: glycosyltransferase [Methanobacterium sp.]